MTAATQELSKEPNQESAKPAASFLEACNLFEKGLLSNHRIYSLHSPALGNIKKGMAFFEKCVTATKKQVTLGTVCLIYLCYVQCLILIGYVCRGSFCFEVW